jgi:hypothetical protein
VDAAAKALNRFEVYTKYKDFKAFHYERAVGFKKHLAFLDFVLSHYVSVDVEELDQERQTPLLRLKCHNSITDVLSDLGEAEDVGQVFTGFRKYLNEQQAVV